LPIEWPIVIINKPTVINIDSDGKLIGLERDALFERYKQGYCLDPVWPTLFSVERGRFTRLSQKRGVALPIFREHKIMSV